MMNFEHQEDVGYGLITPRSEADCAMLSGVTLGKNYAKLSINGEFSDDDSCWRSSGWYISKNMVDTMKTNSNIDIPQLLSTLDYIRQKVFDNEGRFLSEVYGKVICEELLTFHMSSDSCKLTLLLRCGQHFTDTVDTTDVLAWINTLEDDKTT